MNTLKNKILMLCPNCQRVKLVPRSDYDMEGAVFVEVDCIKCEQVGSKESITLYYNQKGFMNYEIEK